MGIQSKNGHFILTDDNRLTLGNSKVRIFKPAVLAMFPCENDEDLCHRISFQTMKEVIGFAFDPSIENPFTVLKNLRDLVMIHKVWNEVTRQIEYWNSDLGDTEAIVEELCQLWPPRTPELSQNFVDFLDDFLMELNNAPANLRRGSANWNHSIGNAFDPAEAYGVDEENMRFQLGYVDGFILQIIENGFIPTGSGKEMCIYTGIHSDGSPFVYSSQNPENEFEPVDNVDPCDFQIVYPVFDLDTWKSIGERTFSGTIALPPDPEEQ